MRQPSVLTLLVFLALTPLGSAANELKPEETRGKQIYIKGTRASGVEIKAALGDDGENEVAASVLPCAGCHGLDGHGGQEGGVRPSDLTPEALSRAGAGARRHPPYDDRLLIRAIAMGLDAAGNRLHVAMPRYRLTRQDAADLLAYLKKLGHEEEPGLSPTAVHFGFLLPGGAGQEGVAVALQAALAARCAELNRGGGVYGRQLTLHFVKLAESPVERAASLREFLTAEPVFALLGTYLTAAESATAAAAGVPLISALGSHPREDFPLNRYAFYLTPGVAEQAAALLELAARRLPEDGRTLVIVRPTAAELAGFAEAAAEAARRRGFTAVETIGAETPAAQIAALVHRLAHFDAAAILVLDNGGAREVLRQAQAQGWRPLVLLPSALAGSSPDLLPDLGERLFVSLPILPADWLAAEPRLPAHHAVVQRAALAAAEVLIEGLKRAGREVSRDKLIATLETLYRFDAGLGAPVTFGPNRRIGARGAFVTAIDSTHPALGQQVSWIDLDP